MKPIKNVKPGKQTPMPPKPPAQGNSPRGSMPGMGSGRKKGGF